MYKVRFLCPENFNATGEGSGGLVNLLLELDNRCLAAKPAPPSSPLAVSTDPQNLIIELVTLVRKDNSGFANRTRIREIGEELNRQGGMKLMQEAYYKVRATGTYFSQDIWHEIGEWQQ